MFKKYRHARQMTHSAWIYEQRARKDLEKLASMFSYALGEQEARWSMTKAQRHRGDRSENGMDALDHFVFPVAGSGMALVYHHPVMNGLAALGGGYAVIRGSAPAAKFTVNATAGSRNRVERLQADVKAIETDVHEDMKELTVEQLVNVAESVAKATGKMRPQGVVEDLKDFARLEQMLTNRTTWSAQMLRDGAIHRQATDYTNNVMSGLYCTADALRSYAPLARSVDVDVALDGLQISAPADLDAFLAAHIQEDDGFRRFDAKWTLPMRDLRALQDWTNGTLVSAGRWFNEIDADAWNPGHEVNPNQYDSGLLF